MNFFGGRAVAYIRFHGIVVDAIDVFDILDGTVDVRILVRHRSLPACRPPSVVVCQLPGGTSIFCHVLSFGAAWARSDWVY